MGRAREGKAAAKAYVDYYKAQVGEFSTWPVERLVMALALEAVTQEMHRDIDAEYLLKKEK